MAAGNDGDVYDDVRGSVGYNEDENRCHPGSLSAFDKKMKAIDFNFNVANDHCKAFVIAYGTAFSAASVAKTFACKGLNDSAKGQSLPAPPPTPIPGPQWALQAGVGVAQCALRSSELATWTALCSNPTSTNPYHCGQVTLASTDVARCCAASYALSALFSHSLVVLGSIYGVAESKAHDVQVCGKDWQTWKKIKVDSSTNSFQEEVWKNTKGPYSLCLDVLFSYNGDFEKAASVNEDGTKYQDNVTNYYSEKYDGKTLQEYCKRYKSGSENKKGYNNLNMIEDQKSRDRNIKNQFYREFLFGGMEYIDKSGGNCKNPDSEKINWEKNLGYGGKEQRYYMNGSGENFTSNFACQRFSPYDANARQEAKESYECCIKRSAETLCLDDGNRGSVKFCKEGTKCKISDVDYAIYRGFSNQYFLCAKSFSLCPFNYTVGLGTEIFESDNKGGYVNHCQYLNHCARVTSYDDGYFSSFDGKGASYISSACKDLRGDSQFNYNFEIDIPQVSSRNFTAPISQCFSETITNFLLNRAGSSKCTSGFPSRANICGNDQAQDYIYKKGQYLSEYPSILETIRQHLKTAVRIALILAIVFFGVSILFAMPKVPERKTILIFCLKLAFVMYFVIGDAWQSKFIEGVLGSSKVMSGLTFRANDDRYEEIYEDRKQNLLNQEEYMGLNNQFTKLEDYYSTYQANIRNIEGEILATNQAIKDLEKNLSDATLEFNDALDAKDNEEQNIISLIDSLQDVVNGINQNHSSLDGDYDALISNIKNLNQKIQDLNISDIDLIPVPQKPYNLTNEQSNIILESGQDKTTLTSGYIFDERQRIARSQEQYQQELKSYNLAKEKLEIALKKALYDYNLEQEKLEIALMQKEFNSYSQLQTEISQATSILESAKDDFNKKLLNIAYIKQDQAYNIANSLQEPNKTQANRIINNRAITSANAKNGVYAYADEVHNIIIQFADPDIDKYLKNISEITEITGYYTISGYKKTAVSYSPLDHIYKPYKFVYYNDSPVSNYRFTEITEGNFASSDSLKEISSTVAQSNIDVIVADYRAKGCITTNPWGLYLICRKYAELTYLHSSFNTKYLEKLRDSLKDYENCSSCIKPLRRNTLDQLLNGESSIFVAKDILDQAQIKLDNLYQQNTQYDPSKILTQEQIDQKITEYSAKKDPELTFEQAKSEIENLIQNQVEQDRIANLSQPNSVDQNSVVTKSEIDQLITDFAAKNNPPLTFDQAKAEILALAKDQAEQNRITNLAEPVNNSKEEERLNILGEGTNNLLPNRISLLNDQKILYQKYFNIQTLEQQKYDIASNIETRGSCFCRNNLSVDSDNLSSLTKSDGNAINCQGSSGASSYVAPADCIDFDGNIASAQAKIDSLLCQISYKKYGESIENPNLQDLTDEQKNKCQASDYVDPNLFALNQELNQLQNSSHTIGDSGQTFSNTAELEAELNRLAIELVGLEAKYEDESRKLALKESEIDGLLDGCQFPRYNYQEMYKYDYGADKGNGTYDGRALSNMDLSIVASYPPGSEYLAIFDTLDCKIARALGFAPGVSVPNILLLIIGSFFTGGLGILFFVGAFLFGFFMISISIRALHLFVMSIIAMATLIYISPITIMCSLFSKTNDIFQKWYKSLMGVALQPMILFAYITVMIAVFDSVIIGSAHFKDGSSNKTTDIISGVEKKLICNEKAQEDSIYCIFRVADIKNLTGFEALGIGIPVLFGLNSAKIMTIFKAALTMYIFMQFIDKISSLANKLVGGGLKDKTISVSDMAQRTGRISRNIQKRGARALKKFSPRIIGSIAPSAKKPTSLRQGNHSASSQNKANHQATKSGSSSHNAGNDGISNHSPQK